MVCLQSFALILQQLFLHQVLKRIHILGRIPETLEEIQESREESGSFDVESELELQRGIVLGEIFQIHFFFPYQGLQSQDVDKCPHCIVLLLEYLSHLHWRQFQVIIGDEVHFQEVPKEWNYERSLVSGTVREPDREEEELGNQAMGVELFESLNEFRIHLEPAGERHVGQKGNCLGRLESHVAFLKEKRVDIIGLLVLVASNEVGERRGFGLGNILPHFLTLNVVVQVHLIQNGNYIVIFQEEESGVDFGHVPVEVDFFFGVFLNVSGILELHIVATLRLKSQKTE